MEDFPEAEEDFDIEIVTTDGTTTYRVNGREYHSLNELPPDVRDMIKTIQNRYVDGRRPGVETFYEIDDKVYESLDDVPFESRELLARLESGETSADGEYKAKVVRNYYRVDEKEYGSFEDIPPELQKQVSRWLKSGKGKTFEYITRDGVTRKFIDGREVPMRPGERMPRPGTPAAGGKRHGPAHLGESQAELYRKITATRPGAPEELPGLDAGEDRYRLAQASRRAALVMIGRIVTAAAYVALILWSQLQPAGFSSYVFLGFLAGDIISWLIFVIWGYQKNMVEFDLMGLVLRAGGLMSFIVLTSRQGAFDVAPGLQRQAVAIAVMTAVVVAFAKWVANMFGLVRRVTEGF